MARFVRCCWNTKLHDDVVQAMPLRLGLQPDLVRSKYCQDKGAQLIRQLAQSDTTTHHPEKGTLVLLEKCKSGQTRDPGSNPGPAQGGFIKSAWPHRAQI